MNVDEDDGNEDENVGYDDDEAEGNERCCRSQDKALAEPPTGFKLRLLHLAFAFHRRNNPRKQLWQIVDRWMMPFLVSINHQRTQKSVVNARR